MKIKHDEILIESGKPFENCQLNRQKYADVLTNIINSYSYGFVLSINNKWGTGKTTFIKMWRQNLIDNDYKTLYFNAWENDFDDRPLVALMGELKSLTTKKSETKYKKALNNVAVIAKHVAPIVVSALAEKYVDTKAVKEAIDGVTKGAVDVFKNEVEEYSKKKKGIDDFKQSLSDFVACLDNENPLIFFIDELDRCRPNYAVSILEQIKHFFSVPNIIFVLSIDKQQLGNAIRGVYGSDRIDSEEYLRRFIDVEYSIPKPERGTYYKYLLKYFDFNTFFSNDERLRYSELRSDQSNFLSICKLIFKNQNLSLRQQEKIFAIARLALRSFEINQYVVPHIFLLLSFLKIIYHQFYVSLKSKNLAFDSIQKGLMEIFEVFKEEEDLRQLMWIEAYLLTFYNNSLDYKNQVKFYKRDQETGENILLLKSIFYEENETSFLGIFEGMRYGQVGDLGLDYFTDKIDLVEQLKN